MTFDDPDDAIFGHLDDPTPPTHGGDALPGVMQRGQQIRRRRRSAYAISTTFVVVALAGGAIAVASSGAHTSNTQKVGTLHSPTQSGSPQPSKKATSKSSHRPGTLTTSPIIGGTGQGGQPVHHHHHHHHAPTGGGQPTPPTCITPAPPIDPPSAAPSGSPSDGTGGSSPPPASSPTPTPSETPICTSPPPSTSPTATPAAGSGSPDARD